MKRYLSRSRSRSRSGESLSQVKFWSSINVTCHTFLGGKYLTRRMLKWRRTDENNIFWQICSVLPHKQQNPLKEPDNSMARQIWYNLLLWHFWTVMKFIFMPWSGDQDYLKLKMFCWKGILGKSKLANPTPRILLIKLCICLCMLLWSQLVSLNTLLFYLFLLSHKTHKMNKLLLTFGMFFALTRSSTSKRTSIDTPNSKRSLIIFSTRSLVFMSVGAALCFLPSGVGQLLKITSSMIL